MFFKNINPVDFDLFHYAVNQNKVLFSEYCMSAPSWCQYPCGYEGNDSFIQFQSTNVKTLNWSMRIFETVDGRGPRTSPSASPPKSRFGPTTRAMTKKDQEDWNTTTDGRETFLYMLKMS